MASTDSRPVPIKNVAFRAVFPIYDADGDLVTGAASLDSEVSKDQGAFADCTNEATEIATASGMYYLDLTATEMNADCVTVIVKTGTAGAKTTVLVFYPEETGDINVDVTAWLGTPAATPTVAGVPEVDQTHYLGAAAPALVGGRYDASVGAMASNVMTAAAAATDLTTELQAGLFRALATGTADSGTTTSMVDAGLTQADGYWDDALLVFTSGTLAGVSRRILRFRAADDRVSFWPPTPVAVSTHTYEIWPSTPLPRRVSLSAEEMIHITGHVGAEFLMDQVWVRGKLYIVTWEPTDTNTKVLRFNNPTIDLTDYDAVELANDGLHEFASDIAYSSVTDLLYVLPMISGTNRVVVTSIDPDTLEVADVINDTDVTDSDHDRGGLAVVGDYLYVLTSPSSAASEILRYPLATYTRDTKTALTGLPRGSGLRATHEYLIASGYDTGATGWMARINLDAATFSSQNFSLNQTAPGRAVIIGDFAWFAFGSGSLSHTIARVWLRDITQVTTLYPGFPGGSYGLAYALGSLWLTSTGGATQWWRIDPDTLEMDYHPSPTQGGALTSISADGQYLYAGCDNALDDVHLARIAIAPAPAIDTKRAAAHGVWDAERNWHRQPGSFGQNLQPRFIGAASAGAAGTVTLGTASVGELASEVDDEYNGLVVLIVAGTGVGQQRGITDYVGSTQVVTVDGNWATNPDNTSKLLII